MVLNLRCFFQKKVLISSELDNNARRYFFGKDGDVTWVKSKLKKEIKNYYHFNTDIRNYNSIEKIFTKFIKKNKFNNSLCCSTISHDWAKDNVFIDFNINAKGTLNLLELTKKYCPNSPFIFMSTNKVYGDNPNKLPLVEMKIDGK